MRHADVALSKKTKSGQDGRLVQTQENRIKGLFNALVFLSIAAVAYTDWRVVPEVSLGYLYLLPIALSALVNPAWLTALLAVVCAILADIFYGAGVRTPAVRDVRDLMTLVGFLVVGFLVTQVAKQRNRLVEEVRRQRDEYERDLLLASQVQQQVLPKPPVCTSLELAAGMQTATLLGGDYYDFFQISDDVVDVVIADVSGHGAAASLLMPSLAVALRLRARELGGPAEIIKDLDQVFRQVTNAATFVTMFYARLHQSTKTLQYSNGGHNPPLVVRKNGQALTLEEGGPILGILKDTVYVDTMVQLDSGDILTLFTDGIIEQENAAGEQYSVGRLEEVVKSRQGESASSLVAAISEEVNAFAGQKQQEDDQTIVIVKIL
jgi:serine phosphatase RsbU (regulator of sigma subunit)